MPNIIKDFKLNPLTNAKFVRTSLATFEQNGISKSWEILEAHDSVAVVLYHRSKDAFVLVKQFRPAVYLNNEDGMSIELCAGIVDKKLTLVQIAKEEIEEECGFAVPEEKIEKITAFYSSVGFAGTRQTLFYAEIDDQMKVGEGGGVDEEQIEVIYLPREEAKAFIYSEHIARTSGVMFGFMWWFAHKGEKR